VQILEKILNNRPRKHLEYQTPLHIFNQLEKRCIYNLIVAKNIMMKIPFSPPYIDDDVIKEVVDTLKSGWITTGPKVKDLEQEIKNYSDAKQVLCVNSWTSGAIMMLRWFGVKEGDEVIIPAYTYCATALAVLHAGAKPVMVDSGEDFNISVEAIRKAITSKTKAIIPVDIAGFPCDYDAIMSLVKEPEIKSIFEPSSDIQRKLGRILILNDAAHSLGARYNSTQYTGSETDVAIFSLHAVKNITTAEGGAICINLPEPFDNEKLYAELRMMALNCQTKDAFSKSKAGGWKYDIIGLGMKINMADVNAAIGLAQIREYYKLHLQRKRVFETYDLAFSKHDWALIPPSVIGERKTSYHLYPLRIGGISEDQRDKIINHIALKEVAVNVHFIPMPMLTFFKDLGYDIKDYPQAYKNYACEISLPIYPQLTDEMVRYVIDAVVEAYNKVK
jgi:dTDP-4-amino-4,6-dideoxygalactose transaminase